MSERRSCNCACLGVVLVYGMTCAASRKNAVSVEGRADCSEAADGENGEMETR